ncbi:MAG: ATP-binding protein [Dysgonamonadaceae bacterium]|nr:ATP-binding protein [Dysgonamonadaceae bacterium]
MKQIARNISMNVKKLPIGIQSFEKLRESGYLYVDKTESIFHMIMSGSVYFLSRPRRFGKSLLVSTLEALFKGKKALFKGLYIYDKWDWSQQYPVVRIDWTLIDHSTPEKMEISLMGYLEERAKNYQIILTKKSVPDRFRELITVLHEKTGQKAVVLIDEYDKPITSHLFDSQLNAVRTAVHDFYQVLKGSDEHLQFIFLTGVSKFSGLSVFSALNQLDDITLHEQFASICGYTQEELETNFSDYIDDTAEHLDMTKDQLLDEIRYWYNGYTWDGKTSIYNPFSTLIFFSAQEFAGYWFATGTPTFLVEIIQRHNSANMILEPFIVNEDVFRGYNPPDMEEAPLLFQTGYLTVKRKERVHGIPRYTLDVPNSEVREAFSKSLLNVYGKYHGNRLNDLRWAMEQQINDCDEAGFAVSLEVMIATVPYELHRADEAYYHTMMLIWMRLLGFKIHGETPNNRGRADAVWEQPELTVIAEIKYHAEKKTDVLLQEAMTQIHERRYYNAYTGKIILLGIAFSGKEVGCRMEELNRKAQSKNI